MWDLAVREEDYPAADTMVQRIKTPPLSMRVFLTFARGDSLARNRLVAEATASNSRQSQIAARYVATFLEDFAASESLARLDLASSRRPHIRANAQLFLAWLEVARGRWNGARAAFAESEQMPEAAPVLAQRAIAATLPFLSVPRADLDSIRGEVERWDPGTELAGSDPGLVARLQPHLRLYLLGLLNSRLGDRAAALRYAEEIEDIGGPPEAQTTIRDLARTVRADVALQSGNAGEARHALDSVQGKVPLELVNVPLYANAREFAQEHARHLRVLALSAGQMDREALRWIESSFQGAPSEFVYLAPMHLEQAEIYDRLGQLEKAVDHYRRFVTLWQNCDVPLRPLVEQARARLAQLQN
jgi:tetratricopeptide (TPR) repeat protein